MSFEEAFEMGTDFMNIETGYIYCLQNYKSALEKGLPVKGCRVIDSLGQNIGVIPNSNMKDLVDLSKYEIKITY